MMIYHELRNRQTPHRLCQYAEALHIGDVEHDEDVRFPETFRTHLARIAHIIAEEKLVHLRPRRRVDDA